MTTVIEPGTTFKRLATSQLDGATLASMAVAERSFFIRTQTHLYRIGVKSNATDHGALRDPTRDGARSDVQEAQKTRDRAANASRVDHVQHADGCRPHVVTTRHAGRHEIQVSCSWSLGARSVWRRRRRASRDSVNVTWRAAI